jgi:hypothetical protein
MLLATLHPSLRDTFLSLARGREVSTCLNSVFNFLQGLRQSLEHISVWEAQNQQASSLEFGLTHGVVISSFRGVVNGTVQFDDQLRTGAVKIHDVPIKRFLTQEPNTFEFRSAQRFPKYGFSSRRISTHFTLKVQDMRRSTHQGSLQASIETRLLALNRYLRCELSPGALRHPLSLRERGAVGWISFLSSGERKVSRSDGWRVARSSP